MRILEDFLNQEKLEFLFTNKNDLNLMKTTISDNDRFIRCTK